MISISVREIAADTGIIALSRITISITNIIFIPLLTKSLSIGDYGIWVQLWIFFPLLNALLDLGLPQSMIRFFPGKGKEEYSSDFYALILPIITVSLLFTVIIILFDSNIGNYFFGGNSTVILVLALLIPMKIIIHFLLSLLRSLYQLRLYGLSIIGMNIAELGLASLFIIQGRGLEGAITGLLMAHVIVMISILVFASNHLTWTAPSFKNTKKYLSFGLPLVPMGLSVWTIANSDRYIIVLLIGNTAAGIYDPSYSIAQSVPFLFANVLGITLLPALSSLDSLKKYDDIEITLSLMLKWFLIITLPFIIGATLLGEQVLKFLTTEYIATEGSIIMGPVALALTLYGIKIIFSQSLFLSFRTKTMGATYILAALLNVGLTIALVPQYGILGAAFATIISYMVDLSITIWLVRSLIRPMIPSTTIGKIIISSVALGMAVITTQNITNEERLLIPFIAGVSVYLITTYLLKVLTQYELDMIKDILKYR